MFEFTELPWDTKPQAPQEVFAEIEWNGGVIRIPRLGYMIVNELAEIAKVDPKNAPYRLTLQYSNTLAQATETSPRLCYSIIARILAREIGQRVQLTEEEETIIIVQQEIINAYLEEFRAINDRIMIRAATVILQRVVPGWQEEKTGMLPRPLLEKIYNFQQEEERGLDASMDPEVDAMERMKELEQDLGKLQEASHSIVTAQTGDAPTGNASVSGQAPKNSPAKTSGTSQASTSSKRSKPATKTKGSGFTEKSLESHNSRGSKPKSTAIEN